MGRARDGAPTTGVTPGPRRPASWWGLLSLILVTAPAALATSDGDTFLGLWLSAQSRLDSWSADLVQTRYLATLTRPLSTPGRVWFVAPDRFRWELGRPVKSVALRDGATLWILSPTLRRAEKYHMEGESAGPARDALALLDSGFPRDLEAFRRRFEVIDARETNGVWRFRMRPRSETARRLVPEMALEIGANDGGLRATELRFTDGSRMRNEFTSARAGDAIDPQLFSPGVDATWKITEPLTP